MKRNSVIIKIICILLLLVLSNALVPYTSSAELYGQGFAEETEFDNATSGVDNTVTKASATVIAVVRIVGATIAVVMLFVVAIKYMTSSAGDRADIKKHAVAYVVGAFVLFGAVGILGVLDNIGGSIGNGE